jgi:DNA uptake protein ComE-like DNA-binding protein
MSKKNAFLSFSRRERYGNTLLIFSFLLLCLFPEFLPDLFPPPPLPDPGIAQQQLVHFIQPDTVQPTERIAPKDTLFPFDPNRADKETLVRLGLSTRTAQSILNYREKGGQFRKKEDLARIYTLSEGDYQRIAPYIDIPESRKPEPKKRWDSQKEEVPITIDINKSGKEAWQQLKGIGPGYAGRIIGFRDKLGGFSSIEQVADTYGLPDSVFQQIRPQLIYSPIFRMLPVNRATEEELAAHPYLSKKQARVLVMFRQNHGGFQNLEDLAPIRAIPDSTLQKLAPYLSFEPAL